MKKVLSVILTMTLVFTLMTYSPLALGEVAGNVYGTDIVTYIYDCPVTSYNIGGKTCIDAEILNWYYGFDVYWYADERKLTVDDKGGRFASGQAASGELVDKISSSVGEIVANYYTTDIVTSLNGKEITSYNIGGRTVILAEEMADFGYSVVWDESKRELLIDKPMDFYKYSTELGEIKTIYKFDSYINFAIECMANVMLIKDKNNYKEEIIDKPLKVVTDGMGSQYIKFSDFADILGGKWTMHEEIFTTEDATAQGMISRSDRYVYSFDFFFDNTKELSVVPKTTKYELGQWPNTKGKIEVAYLSHISQININGLMRSIYTQYGGKVYNAYLMVYKDELYIPVQMIAYLMDYDLATLDIISYNEFNEVEFSDINS
ncbi:MAG: hypothetical protein E7396_05400 [Ruminococcaceae bacterium]|nr:hypothetical protein [Oscillospiraceae bacterium]